MSIYYDFKNESFGCWEFIKRAKSTDVTPKWVVKCTKCKHRFFIKAGTVLKRKSKKEIPDSCIRCRPVNAKYDKGYTFGRNINGFTDKSVKVRD